MQENERRYQTISQLPGWAKEPVEDVYRRLNLTGTGQEDGKTRIDASPTYVRALVVIRQVLQLMEQQAGAEELKLADAMEEQAAPPQEE